VAAALQALNSKICCLADALAYVDLLHYKHGGVYAAARAEYSKRRWGQAQMLHHMMSERLYEIWVQELRNAQPRSRPGPIIVMCDTRYSGDGWMEDTHGYKNPRRKNPPIKSLVHRLSQEPGFEVYAVDGYRHTYSARR
jgi:hypothetical protein